MIKNFIRARLSLVVLVAFGALGAACSGVDDFDTDESSEDELAARGDGKGSVLWDEEDGCPDDDDAGPYAFGADASHPVDGDPQHGGGYTGEPQHGGGYTGEPQHGGGYTYADGGIAADGGRRNCHRDGGSGYDGGWRGDGGAYHDGGWYGDGGAYHDGGSFDASVPVRDAARD